MLIYLKKLVRNPIRYIPKGLRRIQLLMCYIYNRGGFYLQARMDIHPKSTFHNPEFANENGGFLPKEGRAGRTLYNLTPWDNTRRDMLLLLLKQLDDDGIDGAYAELGVFRGQTARMIHGYAPARRFYLFDTFEGFTKRGVNNEVQATGYSVNGDLFTNTSIEHARLAVAPQNENVIFVKGYFPDTISEAIASERFAFVHLDADLYEPTIEGLRFFYPRLAPGGLIVVHDYSSWPGARRAVTEFCSDKVKVPMPDKNGSVVIVKTG